MSPTTPTLAAIVLLASGAFAQTHWSFRKVTTSAPASGDARTLAKTLDTFVAKRRTVAGLRATGPASRRTLIRRLFLDVHGLPPSPELIASFVADRRPDAYEKLVDHVLASPRHGERWAQHWLDIVRYADTHGFEVNTPRSNAWPYRDWVIRSLNEGKPYDQFVREQIAGDALGADAGTGFLVAGPAVLQGQVGKDLASRKQARQDELDEIIKSTGTTFLGLTIGCARCHDHKFDPVKQTDYYAMQAVFAGVRYGERPLPNKDHESKLAALVSEVRALRESLREIEPPVRVGRSIVIDDEGEHVTVLRKRAGFGVNPEGRRRGFRDDLGAANRMANISGGRYSVWIDAEGADLIAYRPKAKGRFRVWLSWGCGWATHTKAARYEMDRDGDPKTRDDRRPLRTVDQQVFADGDGDIGSQPLWSGLRDAGVHEFDAESSIVLRGGPGVGTTADVVVLQEVGDDRARKLPNLRRPVNALHNIERFPPAKARFVRFTTFATNSGFEPCIDELEIYSPGKASANIALATAGAKATSSGNYPSNVRHKLSHINDGRYGNERSWISNQHGRGWVQIELAKPAKIDRVVWGRDRNGRYGDRLPFRYEIAVAEKEGAFRVVASSEDRIPFGGPLGRGKAHVLAFRFAGLPPERAAEARKILDRLDLAEGERILLGKGARVFAGMFVKPPPTHRMHRGDAMSGRELVGPDAPKFLGSLGLAADAMEKQRRLALARWIASAEHPLTARVMVNRIWQHHFGTGIVDTPSDFGKSGSKPTHPKLLDWLASAFVEGKWSLKHVHRIILLSATYRQASRPRESALRIDAGNRLLWRFTPRRLEAEAIRDSILCVSGALDLTTGGPGFGLFVPNTNYVRVYEPKKTWTKKTWRRMVYAHKVRMEKGGVFGAFDCPDAGQAAPTRGRSTTALQSLNLFNSSFVLQQARLLANRVEREHFDTDKRVKFVFELTLGRAPKAIEARESAAHVAKHGLASLCRVMLNTNEFLVLP